MVDQIFSELKTKAEASLDHLHQEYGKLQTGRASTALVESIPVDSFGAKVPMKGVATITIPEPQQIAIQPFSRDQLVNIERAIVDAKIGLTPHNDGNFIRLNIPPLTEERRKELVKLVHKYAEESKISIRNARHEAIAHLKQMEKEKTLSEDELRSNEKKVQDMIDGFNQKIEESSKKERAGCYENLKSYINQILEFTMLLTIVAFIVIFSALVLVHEWGHFAAARKAGIKVEEFGIGLPPMAKSLHQDKQGTVYSINWIPFGGFVRLFGEDSSDPKVLKDKKSFASKTIWQRTQVIVAGVVMNFILAWLLITIGFTFGMQPFLATAQDVQAGIENGTIQASPAFYVHDISEDSPLSSSDISAGDFITRINGQQVTENFVIADIIQPNAQVDLQYIKEGDLEKELTITSNDQGKIGLSLSLEQRIVNIQNIKYPFYKAPFKALNEVGRLSVLTVKMLGGVVSSLVGKLTVPEGVAGPVGIFKLTGQYAEQGLMALVQFTALLSISLGVINIMPFPALDGGRFLFIIFELITRKKPNAKWEAVIHSIGFALLMILILVITWNDIVNMISS